MQMHLNLEAVFKIQLTILISLFSYPGLDVGMHANCIM